MKILKFLAILFLVFNLVSCGTKNALEFNDKLVGIQKEVLKKIELVEADTATLDVATRYTNIQKFISSKIDAAKALKEPSDGVSFKQSMIEYMESINKVYAASIVMINNSSDEEKLKKSQDDFFSIKNNAEKLEEKVIEEQKKFASKYKIRLENK